MYLNKIRNLIISLSLVLSCALSGCILSTTVSQRVTLADKIASKHDFVKELVQGDKFLFTVYKKINDPKAPFAVYIEGDGNITTGGMVSDNPTPKHPMILGLATEDTRDNVVYIARPCQYTPHEFNNVCTPAYWTNKRWAEEAVHGMNEAINTVTLGNKIHLIGFSGGGGIAILIAARNDKVIDIITIAGNLNIVRFNEYNKAKMSVGSLNPFDYIEKVKFIPQLHLSGSKDKKVPPFISYDFAQSAKSPCVHIKTISGADHNHGWQKIWPEILKTPLACY